MQHLSVSCNVAVQNTDAGLANGKPLRFRFSSAGGGVSAGGYVPTHSMILAGTGL